MTRKTRSSFLYVLPLILLGMFIVGTYVFGDNLPGANDTYNVYARSQTPGMQLYAYQVKAASTSLTGNDINCFSNSIARIQIMGVTDQVGLGLVDPNASAADPVITGGTTAKVFYLQGKLGSLATASGGQGWVSIPVYTTTYTTAASGAQVGTATTTTTYTGLDVVSKSTSMTTCGLYEADIRGFTMIRVKMAGAVTPLVDRYVLLSVQ
jgi:hypothetical protein